MWLRENTTKSVVSSQESVKLDTCKAWKHFQQQGNVDVLERNLGCLRLLKPGALQSSSIADVYIKMQKKIRNAHVPRPSGLFDSTKR